MADLKVAGGRVLRADGRVVEADVVVDGGRIDALVGDGSTPDGGDPSVLDAAGCLVVPGFVNAHTHVAMTLLRGYADDKPLHAWLEEDIFPVEAHLRPADVAAGARLGLVEMIRAGTTAFCDMYFNEDQIAEVTVEAGLKALLGHGIVTLGKDDDGIEAELDAAVDFVETYDGAGDGRVAAAMMPHAIRTVDPAVLERVGEAARDLGVPVHLHMSETADDVDAVLDRDGRRPAGTAHERGVLGHDAFVAHGVHLDGGDIDRLADAGAGVAHCPTANLKLASGIAPVVDLLDAGVPVGIGTDGPASNNDLDMVEEVRQAALVAKHRERDAAAVPARRALSMGTLGGRRLLGLEGEGLAPGAPADLAVIDLRAAHLTPDHDPISHVVYAANGADVRHTVCDGRVLMRNREVVPFDEAAVRALAEERAAALVARASRGR